MFGTAPPDYIWPSVEDRFNYNKIYSNKFINLNGYMVDMIYHGSNSSSDLERGYKERAQAMGRMNASYMPERGSQYIIIKTPQDKMARAPQPIVNPKRDPNAEFYGAKGKTDEFNNAAVPP